MFGAQKEGQCLVFALYKIYHRVDYLLHEYLNHFVAACNTRASAALCELALVIPRCRTYQFILSFLLLNSYSLLRCGRSMTSKRFKL